GTLAGARNIISGNAVGVEIDATASQAAAGNLVRGNFIGTDVTGTQAVGNGEGMVILGASGNVIGGTTAAERNVISGNSVRGVDITGIGNLLPGGNLVQGNFIGTDAAGGAALPNKGDGVFIDGPNTVGGTAGGAGNLIA